MITSRHAEGFRWKHFLRPITIYRSHKLTVVRTRLIRQKPVGNLLASIVKTSFVGVAEELLVSTQASDWCGTI